MNRWLNLLGLTAQLVGRVYGLAILAAGAALLYWAGRGTLAYLQGTRAAWSDPLACAAGFVGGALAMWAGAHVLRGGVPRLSGKTSSELDAALEAASNLEREDPVAARQILDDYFAREATKEARRTELRALSSQDVEAARALRRELQEELALDAEFRKEVVKKWPEDQRAGMLAEIDQADREVQAELLQLDNAIERLRLR